MFPITPGAQISAIAAFKGSMLAGAGQPGVTHVTNRSFIVQPPQSFDIQACAFGLAAISIWGMPAALDHGLADVLAAYMLSVIDIYVPLPAGGAGYCHLPSLRNLGDGIIHLNDCCKWTVEAIAGYLDETVAVIQSQIP